MHVPALGRRARFGDIYDAKTNEFININVFKEQIQSRHIDIDDNPNTSYQFSFAGRESEKMDAIDVKGDLKLRIWCGMISVNGSASFIKNNRKSSKFIQCSYILKTTTKRESFNWKLSELRNHFDFSGIESQGTHMVVGIQYGGNGVVTLSHKANESVDFEEIKGCLQGKFKYFPSVHGELNAAGTSSHNDLVKDEQLDIKVEADVNIQPGDNITSVEGCKTFKEKLGERLTQYNHEKAFISVLKWYL